ncbi:MAG: 4Fe-4S binding protein [Phycisphaerales bacterium]|nr:4Fe-4S binding protein [Phycisphaerales bacterium]
MIYDNNAIRLRRNLLIDIAKLVMDGNLFEDIDRMPLTMYPQRSDAVRCCIYKDRAITKYRLMAILGHRVENETDELKLLSQYAREALDRQEPATPVLTVIDQACSACQRGSHYVTDACRSCVARPCTVNCRRDAIEVTNKRANIVQEKCINCGLCVKVCPYHAIVYVPVPCEEVCPVDAIVKDETGREHIDNEKCINCGKCMGACPFGAIMERSSIVDVIGRINGDKKTVAMLAPAMAGQFPGGMKKLTSAVKRLGFDDVVEVALGAELTAQNESKEVAEKLSEGTALVTTSCCPAYIEAVNKHVPEMLPYVSDTPTPMHYTGQLVKNDDPDAITVFISPCVAKRQEAIADPTINYVLTTEELGAMLVAAEIEINDCPEAIFEPPASSEGRTFAFSGGVTKAVREHLDETTEIKPVQIDGLDRKKIKLLQAYAKGKCPGNFLEVMSCEGGCVGGPCTLEGVGKARNRVTDFANQTIEKTPQQ